MIDGGGNIRARYDYDPYGRRTKLQGDLDADFGFTGYYVHQPSGRQLALYRAYDADVGRFINRGPIGERGGLNLYDYVGNDPIRYYDPLGLAIGDWWDPRTWFNGGFTESWSDESSSIVNTWGDIVTGNWGDIGNNYDNSSLGQSESIGGGVGTGEKICLGTAVAATTAAIALMVAEAAGIGAPPEDYIPPPKPDGSRAPHSLPGLDPSAGRPPLPNPTSQSHPEIRGIDGGWLGPYYWN